MTLLTLNRNRHHLSVGRLRFLFFLCSSAQPCLPLILDVKQMRNSSSLLLQGKIIHCNRADAYCCKNCNMKEMQL